MTTVLVGTEKGLWRADRDGDGWQVHEPALAGWRVTALGRAPDGRHLAAVASNWFGVALHASEDLVEWEQLDGAPAYPQDGPELSQVWTLTTVGDRVWAGVADAGLFVTDDLVEWRGVPAVNEHPERDTWMPGFGGLCAHHVLVDGERVLVAISSVGVLRSDDGGTTFRRADEGVQPTGTPEDGMPSMAWCVHGLAADPADPDRLWRQEHVGVFRSTDGGDSWERCQTGLPGAQGFGFPVVRDHASGRLLTVPLHSDEQRLPVDGRFAAWASDDDGDSWHVAGTGWPDEPSHQQVLRNAMVGDGAGRVVLGTTAGQVWHSDDAGETWQRLPLTVPRVATVALVP